MSVDMGSFIAPKSDQLNADDLLVGPRTIKVTGVRANEGSAEQPVSIFFEGDNGKPYKACKSMRRVLVYVWGSDAKNYVGRSMTLYCDPNVQFGGLKMGGIRISHMSHIDAPQTMALTATKARRAPFTVQPLVAEPTPPTVAEYESCSDPAALAVLEKRRADLWRKVPTDQKPLVKAAADAAKERLAKASARDAATGSPHGFDAAATEKKLRASKSLEELGSIWITVQARHKDREIPVELEAAFTEMRESLDAGATG